MLCVRLCVCVGGGASGWSRGEVVAGLLGVGARPGGAQRFLLPCGTGGRWAVLCWGVSAGCNTVAVHLRPPCSAAALAQDLKDKSVDTLVWHAPEGFDVKPVYTAADLPSDVSQVPGAWSRLARTCVA